MLQDNVEDVYMFMDDQEGASDAPPEALPTGVITALAKCYSPMCREPDGEASQCYAYGCPRRVGNNTLFQYLSLSNVLPDRAVPS